MMRFLWILSCCAALVAASGCSTKVDNSVEAPKELAPPPTTEPQSVNSSKIEIPAK